MKDTHTLNQEKEYKSGATEWKCPACDRRMVVQMAPRFKRIILDPGDEQINHVGATPGVGFKNVGVSTSEETARLEEPFTKWLDKWYPDLDLGKPDA